MRRTACALVVCLALTGAAAGADERIDRLTKAAEQLRGLTLREPLKVREIDRKDLAAELDRLLAAEPEPTLTPEWEEAYHLLGVLPRDKRLVPTIRGSLADGVAGAYVPSSDELILVRSGRAEATSATVVHEIVHAIQDQRFDLSRGPYGDRPRDLDGLAAATAVVEGDATEVMLRYIGEAGLGGVLGELAGALSQLGGGSGADVPPYFTRSLLLPYEQGQEFAEAVRARRGQAGLDRALRRPPRTSAAVWFPERYLAGRDSALPVAMPRPGVGSRRVIDTTYGVFELVALTDDEALAGGWRGGRLVYDRSPTRRSLRISIRTTGPARLVGTLRRVLPKGWAVRRAGGRVDATVTEARRR